ncbi:MAG: hypothetical protein ACREBQ_03790 [Nitrososphaerales archaeon]
MTQSILGEIFVVIGIIILAVTMLVLFFPSGNIAVPSIVVGIGTILAVIGLGVGLFSKGK